MKRDIPIEEDLEVFQVGIDMQKLEELLKEYEMNSLLAEISK